MRAIKTKRGFTLVEISLSLVFIGILSLTVAYIINDTISSYRKGVTLKQVNTTGAGLVDDIRAAIQNSSSKSVKDDCAVLYNDVYVSGSSAGKKCENDGGKGFASVTRSAEVRGKNGQGSLGDVPVYGAFCAGDYSYIWNTGYFFNTGNGYEVRSASPATLKFKSNGSLKESSICKNTSGGTMTCSGFRLLKVKDDSRAVCVSAVGSSYNTNISNSFDISKNGDTLTDVPIDLLASDGTGEGLALYDLYISVPAESSAKNSLFYSVSFILGTIQGGINIKATGGACAVPKDYRSENFDYCAINKFNFAAQATGG